MFKIPGVVCIQGRTVSHVHQIIYLSFIIFCTAGGTKEGGGAFCFNIFTVPAQTIIKGIYLN